MFRYRDWKCLKCGARSTDVPVTVPDQYCPFCGTPMEKVYTSPTVIFRGEWTPTFHQSGNGGKREV